MRLDDPKATILNQPAKLGPGTIAVLCAEATRSQAFWFSLINLATALPPGLAQLRAFQGSDVAGLRNQAVADFDGEWIWFIDDDHAFPTDILARLARRDVDVVTPVCLRRVQPFLPVATGLDGNFLDLAAHEPDDLVEVMFAGSSGMLIRRRVIEAIEPPWFELGNGVSEDVNFCRKAAAAGFKIHVDLSLRLGHATTAVVWPEWDESADRWGTGFTIADGAQLHIGLAEIPPLEEPVESAA